ncbi:uncharacterized protein STEHIDRAFT_157310 [Stereum hirsutum FP-91666 SS1]|uniref:uncharacterized protein n=1 Tax=Stereum hirsutum (strain FP-91666) TaxID=721885 RepID=UPI000444A890|nr:uncharacterized protein STEHIDRAFT_157310 [Stereum hirsutum FP-91666 SS1]EIM85773.1 hypothetical protein STEHIDRAFT_157310 [Stereum hirsutum FP-91666 SS1]
MPYSRPGSFYTYTQTDPPATIALLAMSFLCWDMIITFGDEVEYIWRSASVPRKAY